MLRGFGLKVGATTAKSFESRVRELAAGHPTLELITQALLSARSTLAAEFATLGFAGPLDGADRPQGAAVDVDAGVGAIVALTYSAAIDDPGRFRSFKRAARTSA